MRGPRHTTIIPLILDLLILGFGLSNIPSLSERARIPLDVELDGDVVIVMSLRPDVSTMVPGDTIVSLNGEPVTSVAFVEFMADRARVGEPLVVETLGGGASRVHTVNTERYYDTARFPVVMGITGFIVIAFGMLQLFRRPFDASARSLHWSLISLGAVVLFTQGPLDHSSVTGTLYRTALFMFYNLLAAWFFLFSGTFPFSRFRSFALARAVVLLPFILLASALSYSFVSASLNGNARQFGDFRDLYRLFQAAFVVTTAVSLFMLVRGYVREPLTERRQALRWILAGLVLAAIPFILFVVFPTLLGRQHSLPEELAVVFTLSIPICFTVAFFRFNQFGPGIDEHRTFVVIILYIITGLVHLLITAVIVSLVWDETLFTGHLLPAIGGVALLILFNPFRVSLHRTLDDALFPARSRSAHILHRTSQRFVSVLSPGDLGVMLVEELRSVVRRAGFFWYRFRDGELYLEHPDPLVPSLLSPPPDVRSSWGGSQNIASKTTERDATLPWVRLQGFEHVIPLVSPSGSLLGAVFVRLERLTEPLRSEEREVLSALCDQASAALTRLDLQEAVIIGQEQRRKLQELNEMKSRFVSSVSHDLRTPLTSITMFTEMMLDSPVSNRKRKEFLRLIKHETERLTRMIAQVLNYSRIERGVREYTFADVSLRDVVQRSVKAFRPQITAVSGTLTLQLPRRSPIVHADAEALEAALLNLLSNALTYGGELKRVKLAVVPLADIVRISVSDRGVGIPADVLPHLAEPFYRGAASATAHAGGMGLGLATVRHTIEAHGGSIDIRSKPGAGTSVILTIPRSDSPEKGVGP